MSEIEYVDPEEELAVRINRIPDSQYCKQVRNSLTISPDYLFWLRFSRMFFDETAAQSVHGTILRHVQSRLWRKRTVIRRLEGSSFQLL
jgi:hypothetical protein